MGYESLPHQEWWFNGIIIGLYLRNHGPCGDLRIFGTIEWGCEMLEDGIGIPRLINFAPIFFGYIQIAIVRLCRGGGFQAYLTMTIQMTIDVHTFRWVAQQNQPVLDGTCIFCFILPGPTIFRWILYYISELHPLVIHGKFSLAKKHPACWKRKVICQEMVFQSHIIFDSWRVLHGTPPFPATRQANQPTNLVPYGLVVGCLVAGGGVEVEWT